MIVSIDVHGFHVRDKEKLLVKWFHKAYTCWIFMRLRLIDEKNISLLWAANEIKNAKKGRSCRACRGRWLKGISPNRNPRQDRVSRMKNSDDQRGCVSSSRDFERKRD